jgi:hypothetical protein
MPDQHGGSAPVFVDRTGRRRRLTVIAGTALGLGLLTSLGLILAGLFFDSPVPLPGWSDTKGQRPVEAGVDASPPPARSGPTSRPQPATSTATPLPSTAATGTADGGRPATVSPKRTDVPGQGDDRRNGARPSRTAGKP